MVHTLKELPYSYDALEPYIDEQTMRIHHTRHHQTYIDKLNAAVKDYDDWNHKPAEELVRYLSDIPEAIRGAVRNHGGGHTNHSFFWPLLKKNVRFGGNIAEAVTQRFESYEGFKEIFSNAAATLFGSGWAWLVFDRGNLEIMTTPNQDSPLSLGKIPIIGLDVWEHAYYLKYQNRRPEYINAFFEVINWEVAEKHYQQAYS